MFFKAKHHFHKQNTKVQTGGRRKAMRGRNTGIYSKRENEKAVTWVIMVSKPCPSPGR